MLNDQARIRATPWVLMLLILGVIVLYLVTVVDSTADTTFYVSQIVEYQAKAAAPPSLLWEFGHLLWRPTGYALWRALHPFMVGWSHDNPNIEITAVLMGVNFLTGIALAILCFFLCRTLGLVERAAVIVTAGFILLNTILRYMHSGMSYNPGLAFQMAALLCLLWAAGAPRQRSGLAVLGGIMLALSFCVWFPYVLTVPSILLASLIGLQAVGQKPGRIGSRLRVTAIGTATTAGVAIALFATGALVNHYSSYSSLKGWVANSAHGVETQNRLVRLPTGITRSFVFFGDLGVNLKRFVLGDPYAPVHFPDLLPALAKVMLVSAGLLLLMALLALRRNGWPALAILISAFAPAILFSVLLFEPSEPARLEPAYPALLVAICAVLILPGAAKIGRPSLAAFLMIMALINLWAYCWSLRIESAKVSERAELIHEHAAPRGIGILLSFRDPVSGFIQKEPFNPLNSPDALPLFHVIETGNVGLETWRSAVACRILQAWSDGGEAWLSDRLRASRPRPEWEFVERDDSRVHWTDLPSYFNVLKTVGHAGGDDGFWRVAKSSPNVEHLTLTAANQCSK